MMSRMHSPEETKAAMHEVVAEMYDRIVKGEPPTMTLPVRTKPTLVLIKNLGSTNTEKRSLSEMLQALVLLNNCCALCT